MRRYVFVILFFVVLITPFVLRAVYAKTDNKPTSTADALPLIVITPHDEGIRREFATAFSRWHAAKYGKPVAVDYRTYGGTSAIVQYFDASRPLFAALGTYHVDVAWGGGDYLFNVQLKGGGHLAPCSMPAEVMKAAYPQPTLAGLPLYDTANPPSWFGICLAGFGVTYNKDVYSYLDLPAPKTWYDLADPKLRNWIVMADPTQSASAKTAYMVIVERAMADAEAAMPGDKAKADNIGWAKGMGQLRQISANARLFVDSGSAQPGVVATGDAAASMVIDFFARATIANVGKDRMAYVEPVNATAINPDPVALVKGAEHEETARHFIEFLLTPEAQRIWITRAGAPNGPQQTELHRMPIRQDVYADASNFTDAANPFKSAEAFNTSNDRKKTFVILGELMQASMIDVLDDLRATRKEILASNHPELDAQLGEFPFDQTEAMRRYDQYHKANPSDRLALMRQWTNEFRAEYKQLREQAEKP